MFKYLVIIGAIVHILGATSYIKDVLRGIIKPNKVTWLMWSIAPLIGTAAAIYKGVSILSVLPVFISGFVPLVVFCISFINKKSYWKLELFDYVCGVFSLLALTLWGITKEPNIAIIFAILSDASAAFPTLTKAWNYPETEFSVAYIASLFNSITAIFAISIISFSAIAFPVYLVILNTILFIVVYRNKLKIFLKSK